MAEKLNRRPLTTSLSPEAWKKLEEITQSLDGRKSTALDVCINFYWYEKLMR